MNYFTENQKIKYIGCTKEQINWGSNDDPTNILTVNEIYEIEKIDVHSQHTKLTLKGISGRFNSVCFTEL